MSGVKRYLTTSKLVTALTEGISFTGADVGGRMPQKQLQQGIPLQSAHSCLVSDGQHVTVSGTERHIPTHTRTYIVAKISTGKICVSQMTPRREKVADGMQIAALH